MREIVKERIEGLGFVLRFVLPLAVFLGGWLITDKLDTITESQGALQDQVFDVKIDVNQVKLQIESMKSIEADVQRMSADIKENRQRIRDLEIK